MTSQVRLSKERPISDFDDVIMEPPRTENRSSTCPTPTRSICMEKWRNCPKVLILLVTLRCWTMWSSRNVAVKGTVREIPWGNAAFCSSLLKERNETWQWNWVKMAFLFYRCHVPSSATSTSSCFPLASGLRWRQGDVRATSGIPIGRLGRRPRPRPMAGLKTRPEHGMLVGTVPALVRRRKEIKTR